MIDGLWAVIPAAGKGVRAGFAVPKQFVSRGRFTLLEWTLIKVLSLPEVDGVIVPLPYPVLKVPDVDAIRKSFPGFSKKPVEFTVGGDNRQESVYNGLQRVPENVSWIMIHDAVRPFITYNLFRRVLEAALASGAAICGLNATDTVKLVRGSVVCSTVERGCVFLVQTPQIFRGELIKQAHRLAKGDGFLSTDDSHLVERLGHPVVVVPGDKANVKLTYPGDFEEAEKILKAGFAGSIPWISPVSSHERKTTRQLSSKRLAGRRMAGQYRVGFGFDLHPLVPGRKCIIGGVDIPHQTGLLGHSDGDVLIHSVIDAILGALGLRDIGYWFPDDSPEFKNMSSLDMLSGLWNKNNRRIRIHNIDCTILAESPRISPYVEQMKANIAGRLYVEPEIISIKATTAEGLGALGRGEGIACFSVAGLSKGGFLRGTRRI